MTTFDEREHAFEAKLAHDEELRFRARARRDKRLGLWAAGKLGKTGPEAEAYASHIITIDVEKSGVDRIVSAIKADFDKAGIAIPDTEVRKQMDLFLAEAVHELTKGTGPQKK